MMDKHGLTKEKGWTFEWIKSQRTAGRCISKSKKGTWGTWREYCGGIIQLSNFVTLHHDDAKVLDTILHEIAHGLTPGHGHDNVWKRKAIEIGCNGHRCYEVKGALAEVREKISKVVGECPKCQHKFFMTRMPKRDQWCKCTGRRFIQSEKIVWVLNGNVAPNQ